MGGVFGTPSSTALAFSFEILACLFGTRSIECPRDLEHEASHGSALIEIVIHGRNPVPHKLEKAYSRPCVLELGVGPTLSDAVFGLTVSTPANSVSIPVWTRLRLRLGFNSVLVFDSIALSIRFRLRFRSEILFALVTVSTSLAPKYSLAVMTQFTWRARCSEKFNLSPSKWDQQSLLACEYRELVHVNRLEMLAWKYSSTQW
jgi:hypothetical protein